MAVSLLRKQEILRAIWLSAELFGQKLMSLFTGVSKYNSVTQRFAPLSKKLESAYEKF